MRSGMEALRVDLAEVAEAIRAGLSDVRASGACLKEDCGDCVCLRVRISGLLSEYVGGGGGVGYSTETIR